MPAVVPAADHSTDHSTDHCAAHSAADGAAAGEGTRPARVDERARWRRMVGAVSVAVAAVAASGYVWAVDPNVPGHYPLCPTRALLGLDCPGCGGLRGMHDLLHGNVAGALDHNAALAVMIPAALVAWAVWVRRAWTGRIPSVSRTRLRWRTRAGMAAFGLLIVFAIVRNLVPYLGSGA